MRYSCGHVSTKKNVRGIKDAATSTPPQLRSSRYIRYRDNIGYPRYGERYDIGDNQYSSNNLSYCPINRFLESISNPISVWRAAVCVCARLRMCSFSSPRFYIWRAISIRRTISVWRASIVCGLDHPDTSIPGASKMAQLIFRDQNYVSSAIHFICVYTMSIHLIYLVSDLEGSDNGDPIYGIIY